MLEFKDNQITHVKRARIWRLKIHLWRLWSPTLWWVNCQPSQVRERQLSGITLMLWKVLSTWKGGQNGWSIWKPWQFRGTIWHWQQLRSRIYSRRFSCLILNKEHSKSSWMLKLATFKLQLTLSVGRSLVDLWFIEFILMKYYTAPYNNCCVFTRGETSCCSVLNKRFGQRSLIWGLARYSVHSTATALTKLLHHFLYMFDPHS